MTSYRWRANISKRGVISVTKEITNCAIEGQHHVDRGITDIPGLFIYIEG